MPSAYSPNKDVPHPQDLEEVLAIAYTLEREAQTRYSDLACSMRLVGRPDLAALFGDLAKEEEHHIAAVEGLATKTLQRMPSLAGAFSWQLPEIFGSADRTVVTNALTPYEALVAAVHNEERAFAFWLAIAAKADDTIVRQQAEAMAREELLHAAALRIARRRAYRAGGRVRPFAGISDASSMIEHLNALRSDCARFLNRAAAHLVLRGDEMSAALLRFASEEIVSKSQTADSPSATRDDAVEGHPDCLALLFDAVGRVEQVSEAARNCIEVHPELATGKDVRRLPRSAAVQVAILNRRLAELEPRLIALATPVGQTAFR